MPPGEGEGIEDQFTVRWCPEQSANQEYPLQECWADLRVNVGRWRAITTGLRRRNVQRTSTEWDEPLLIQAHGCCACDKWTAAGRQRVLSGKGWALWKRNARWWLWEKNTPKKKKKFCSWFIFLLWAYPVSLFLEKSCSLRYHLSILETLLPREVCNSGKNKSWGCLKKKSGKSNRMAGSKGEWKGWLFWGATT